AQPRPNVLFEAGMAFGHQPDRTILVEVGSPKPFSDIAGRHTVRLTNDISRRQDLAERLRTAGCAVNTSGDGWRPIGTFEIESQTPERVAKPAAPVSRSVKFVDINYPADSGLVENLKLDGFRTAWCSDSKLARKLDIDGWSLATVSGDDGNEVVLKMKD